VRIAGLLACLAGCQLVPPPAHARVLRGAAHADPPTTIVALPIATTAATPEQAAAVASATRMALELDGYTVVDAELINAEMRRRTTETVERLSEAPPAPSERPAQSHSDTTTETKVSGGKTWLDAGVVTRTRLIAEVGAQGLLSTAIERSTGAMPWNGQVTVDLTLMRLDGRLVWRSECSANFGAVWSSWWTTQQAIEQAIERATHCALESAALW
jgi:hypothetical protein